MSIDDPSTPNSDALVRAELVPPALAGQRVDRLTAIVGDVSRAVASELVAAGKVTVGGEVVTKASEKVGEGIEVAVDVSDVVAPIARPEPESDIEVPVVYVDDHLIVVDKPAGLVVHPGAGHDRGTMVAGLVARFPEIADVGEAVRPGIVHRLDRDTSGLLVVARTTDAYEALVAQLSARSVERRYVALVVGIPDSTAGLIDAPIGRSPRTPTLMAVRADGKEARTRYQVEETFDSPSPVSLVECRLETGRTHQIRVHMKAIGHPIVGDDRYGGGRSAVRSVRPFLHAGRLGLVHPATGEDMSWESPLPTDLQAVLDSLRA